MSTEYRGLILEHGFVPQLSSLGVKGLGLEMTLSNDCCTEPAVSFILSLGHTI